MPVLSVIVPVYNGERFLEEAVLSVKKQPCKNVEIIIVNDGSKDNSGEIADCMAKEQENIKAIHITNHGVSYARNLGIEAAKGDYIAFLDADDVWCKNVYTCEIEAKLCSGAYDVVSFGYFKTDERLEKGMEYSGCNGFLDRNDPSYDYVANKNHFSSYIYAKHLFENVRFPEGVRYGEDLSFQFLITRPAKNILMMDTYWFMYRTNRNSVMNTISDFDYALGEIDGWYGAKKCAKSEEDRLLCDAMFYCRMYKYLTLSSKNGKSYKKLYQDMLNCKPYQEAIENFGNYIVPEANVEFMKKFTENPKMTCRTMRRQGFLHYTIRNLIRKTFLKEIYFKLKYKVNLEEYRIRE